jgi:hypothetical protein
MKRILRGTLSLSAMLCVPSALAGCSSEDAGPTAAERAEASAEARHAQTDEAFHRQLSSAIIVGNACANDRTEACALRALSDPSLLTTRSGSVQIQDAWSVSDVKRLVSKARSLTRSAICQTTAWARNNVRLYYFNGVSVQGAAGGGYLNGGGERVWDLKLHQAVGYGYGGGGIGNVTGFSASVYEGYAVAAQGGGLHDNWDGCFLGGSVSVAFPETQIGAGIGSFRGCSLGAKNAIDLVTAVQGVTWNVSAGLNVANVVAVTAQVGATYYVAFNPLTQSMHSSYTDDVIEDDRGEFLNFTPVNVPVLGQFSAGYSQAANILYNGPSAGSLVAAAAAIGIDLLERDDGYCNSRTAEVLPCGGSGGGVSTAACSGGGESWPPADDGSTGDTTPITPGTDAGPTPAPTPTMPISCAIDSHCSPDDLCSPNGPDSFCCRPTFTSDSPVACDPGLDSCGAGKICALGGIASDPSLAFTCIDPKEHPCSATNP